MNIHPAFVHFPIALLTLYAIIEILPLARLIPRVQWSPIRAFLLYVGTAGALVTAITGGMAEDVVGETPAVTTHETAAYILIGIFLLSCVLSYVWRREMPFRTWTMKVLALLGLIMLFVVGALGANIVYGHSVDPIVSFVTGLLGLR